MALSPFMAALNQIADEKGLDMETVIGTVEQAIAAAYRKDYGKPRQVIKVTMHQETGIFEVFQVFAVVEEVENDEAEIDLTSATKFNKKAVIGDEITVPLPYHDEFGRIAAQTAKQVIIQRLKEAERDVIYNEYKDKEGEILPATVQQIEGNTIIVNLGKSNALLLPSDQIRNEHYYTGQRLRVYVRGVEETPKGPRILVSRSDEGLIAGLFTLEVPELQAGTVVLKGVAREGGSRSKVAVMAAEATIDPVGSCVGQRGTRIQAILAELGEEKIDIILWDDNPAQFLANALSPARIDEVHLDDTNKTAKVFVAEDQLSLAIGKNGQNVRLAGKLSGYEIDIVRTGDKDRTQRESVKSTDTPTESKISNVKSKKIDSKSDDTVSKTSEPTTKKSKSPKKKVTSTQKNTDAKTEKKEKATE
ncbi:transcription termination factor NusA [Candidatus Berkelbacteria bacterium CG2_30_43_20]|nr:MAG: transcription termination factor NusA [Candidatus Berkelbacteria bacterium CG2_30_43_20]